MNLSINITLDPADVVDIKLVPGGAIMSLKGVEVRLGDAHIRALLQGMGKRRARRDRLSLPEKLVRRAQAPAAQATLGALEALQEKHEWVFVSQLVEALNHNPDKVRASLHALKHAGFAESKVSDILNEGARQPLVMWRVSAAYKASKTV